MPRIARIGGSRYYVPQDSYYGHGQQVPGKLIYYTESASHVISPGGGVEVAMSQYVSFKLDVQLQRFATPVTASGYLNATSTTVGVGYRFHLGDRRLK